MSDNKWKKMADAVDTIGDWAGYHIYEGFKLFPEARVTALREYMYVKAHLVQSCAKMVGQTYSLEEWNDFYLTLGKQMEATPDYSYGANYEEMCEALHAYEGLSLPQVRQVFAKRAGIGATVYSQQFVPELTNLFSRCMADLRKNIK